jgi:hypothetical protein
LNCAFGLVFIDLSAPFPANLSFFDLDCACAHGDGHGGFHERGFSVRLRPAGRFQGRAGVIITG